MSHLPFSSHSSWITNSAYLKTKRYLQFSMRSAAVGYFLIAVGNTNRKFISKLRNYDFARRIICRVKAISQLDVDRITDANAPREITINELIFCNSAKSANAQHVTFIDFITAAKMRFAFNNATRQMATSKPRYNILPYISSHKPSFIINYICNIPKIHCRFYYYICINLHIPRLTYCFKVERCPPHKLICMGVILPINVIYQEVDGFCSESSLLSLSNVAQETNTSSNSRFFGFAKQRGCLLYQIGQIIFLNGRHLPLCQSQLMLCKLHLLLCEFHLLGKSFALGYDFIKLSLPNHPSPRNSAEGYYSSQNGHYRCPNRYPSVYLYSALFLENPQTDEGHNAHKYYNARYGKCVPSALSYIRVLRNLFLFVSPAHCIPQIVSNALACPNKKYQGGVL